MKKIYNMLNPSQNGNKESSSYVLIEKELNNLGFEFRKGDIRNIFYKLIENGKISFFPFLVLLSRPIFENDVIQQSIPIEQTNVTEKFKEREKIVKSSIAIFKAFLSPNFYLNLRPPNTKLQNKEVYDYHKQKHVEKKAYDDNEIRRKPNSKPLFPNKSSEQIKKLPNKNLIRQKTFSHIEKATFEIGSNRNYSLKERLNKLEKENSEPEQIFTKTYKLQPLRSLSSYLLELPDQEIDVNEASKKPSNTALKESNSLSIDHTKSTRGRSPISKQFKTLSGSNKYRSPSKSNSVLNSSESKAPSAIRNKNSDNCSPRKKSTTRIKDILNSRIPIATTSKNKGLSMQAPRKKSATQITSEGSKTTLKGGTSQNNSQMKKPAMNVAPQSNKSSVSLTSKSTVSPSQNILNKKSSTNSIPESGQASATSINFKRVNLLNEEITKKKISAHIAPKKEIVSSSAYECINSPSSSPTKNVSTYKNLKNKDILTIRAYEYINSSSQFSSTSENMIPAYNQPNDDWLLKKNLGNSTNHLSSECTKQQKNVPNDEASFAMPQKESVDASSSSSSKCMHMNSHKCPIGISRTIVPLASPFLQMKSGNTCLNSKSSESNKLPFPSFECPNFQKKLDMDKMSISVGVLPPLTASSFQNVHIPKNSLSSNFTSDSTTSSVFSSFNCPTKMSNPHLCSYRTDTLNTSSVDPVIAEMKSLAISSNKKSQPSTRFQSPLTLKNKRKM